MTDNNISVSSVHDSAIRHRWIYGLMLFASLFMYFYPDQFRFLPVSTTRLVQLAGLLLFVVHYIKRPMHDVMKKIIIYGVIIFIVGFMASKLFSYGGDLNVANRGILMIMYLFSAYFIAFCLVRYSGEYSIYPLLEMMVYITIFQALVSFMFFLVPSTYEIYKGLVVMDDFNDDMTSLMSSVRLMSMGAIRYATAASQYGLVMWALILLKEKNYGFFARHRVIYSLVTSLFCLAGILSGRVFFVMLPVTVLYIFILKNMKVKDTILSCIATFLPVLIVGAGAFIYLFAENEELIKWAFELFINLDEMGSMESASTNELKEMYVFPTELKTWIIGDGKSLGKYTAFYMASDVGYVRSLFYWGITGTVIYYLIQYLCYKDISTISPDNYFKSYLLFILLWLLIFSFKDFYSIEKFYVLFAVVLALNAGQRNYLITENQNNDEVHDCNTCV